MYFVIYNYFVCNRALFLINERQMLMYLLKSLLSFNQKEFAFIIKHEPSNHDKYYI